MSPQPHRLWPARFLERLTFSAVFVLAVVAAETASQAESWTDLAGTRTIEARMLGMWNDNVVLEMGNRRVTVPLMALRSDSRIQAGNLWKEIQLTRSSRIQELQGLAKAAAAPAPNPLPKPAPAPAYQKPVANAKVSEFLQQYDDQLAAGHVLVMFDALPPSYRSDIDQVVKLAAAKINPATWFSITTSVQQLGDLVVTRQNWFFSNPRLAALPPDDFDSLQEQLLLVGGLLREGFQADAMQLTKLQSMNFGQWLAERDQAIAPYVAALKVQQDISGGRRFEVVSETADAAVVKMSVGGKDVNEKWKKVDGFWVSEQLAATWADRIASKKRELQDTPEGAYLADLAVLAALQPMIQPLASAPDEGAFHESMEVILAGLQPMVMTLATTAGMNMSVASASGRSGRQSTGYGDEDMYGGEDMGMDEMEMEDMGMDEMEMEEMEMEEMEDFGGGAPQGPMRGQPDLSR